MYVHLQLRPSVSNLSKKMAAAVHGAVSELDAADAGPSKQHQRLPSIRLRVLVALGIGISCGLICWSATRLPGFRSQDFAVWRMAADAVLHAHNPYATIVDPLGRPEFFYPLPTALAFAPSLLLPVTIGGPLFAGISCALLAYVATAEAWWPLLMFVSGSMYACVVQAQLSPILTAAMLLPGATWLGVLKPNIGLAMLARKPSWRSGAVMVVIACATIPIMPTWPAAWVRTAASSPFHFAAWRAPGGFFLLLALLRWRLPDGRLLAAMALVPTSPFVYEVLPLLLIARSKIELTVLVVFSDLALLAVIGYSAQNDTSLLFARARLSIVWLMYVPALVMVLSRRSRRLTPDLTVPAAVSGSSLRQA